MDSTNESYYSFLYIKNIPRPITERIEKINKQRFPPIIKKRIFSLNNKKSILTTIKKPMLSMEYRKPKFDVKLCLNCPTLTSEAWGAFNGFTGEIILGKNYTSRREIASLTKIMTCYTVISLSKAMNIEIRKELVIISKKAAYINGTKAELETGDKISIYDLLFGLMLPSGNDAALALADHFARLLYRQHFPTNQSTPQKIVNFFITEMNKNALKFGMKRTSYSNPHGLSDNNNKSTVQDLGILTFHAMKDELFRTIVKTQFYKAYGFDIFNERKEFEWNNRNILLDCGFNGVKTGTTPSAGHCLCSSIERNGKSIIMILLSSKSKKTRFSETKKLFSYLISNYQENGMLVINQKSSFKE